MTHPPQQVDGAPGTGGLGLLKRLRSVTTTGIITLGTNARLEDCIQALAAGADDHLNAPFDRGELVARMWAVLGHRRTAPPSQPLVASEAEQPLLIDLEELVARMWAVHRRTAPPSQPLVASEAEQPLLIDLTRHEVVRSGERVHLTGTELRLLELLVAQAGVLLSHEMLLRHVWGEGYGTESNYLRVYVAQLRKKLGDQAGAPRLIETTPGVGYRWIGSDPRVSRRTEELVDA